MRSRAQRLALLGAAALVLVAAVALLRSGDDDADSKENRPTTVKVRGKRPVSGVRELRVAKDQSVRFTVTSDQPEEVHVHGYDLSREVGPDLEARYDFPATIEGVFEVELERSGVAILELTVAPG